MVLTAALVPLVLLLAWPPQALGEPACRRISLEGDLKAGDAYVQEIGAGLELRLTPRAFAEPAPGEGKGPDGWRITLEPAAAQQDHIYPVNLPLRFNPRQDIGTSYGIVAKEKLRDAVAYRFVPSEADYDKIGALLQGALWPYSATDPEHAQENYMTALEGIDTGLIRFRPTRYDLSENGERIRRLAFIVEITAPRDFAFLQSLAPEPAACPSKDD
jgi:hypothetical protein